MKKMWTLLLLLNFSRLIDAGLIKLPDEKTLQERLYKKGFGHFIEETQLITELANQEKEIFEVNNIIESTLFDYKSKNSTLAPLVEQKKSELFDSVLEDYPEELKSYKAGLKQFNKKTSKHKRCSYCCF